MHHSVSSSSVNIYIAGSASSVQIHWYIMTSPFTDDATRKFFESHKFFGLEAEQVDVYKPFSVFIVLLVSLLWTNLFYIGYLFPARDHPLCFQGW